MFVIKQGNFYYSHCVNGKPVFHRKPDKFDLDTAQAIVRQLEQLGFHVTLERA